jgi:acyl-CoA synthetase (AMP-forming)/AMP-acid ligase II
MDTLSDLLARNARLHGDRLCFAGAHPVTHRAFAERCWSLANGLAAMGLQKGDRIAFLLRNCIEALEIYGAAEAAGYVVVPLNWRLSAAELSLVLADCTPACVITAEEFAPVLAGARATAEEAWHAVVLGAAYEHLVAQGKPERPAQRPEAGDLAHIVYTSGTTGKPKGVMWTQGAVLHSAQALALASGSKPTDNIVISMPLFHVGAKIEWLGVQLVGGTAVLLDHFDEIDFFLAVQDYGANVAHLAPTMVKRLVEHPRRGDYGLRGLRRVMYGSAPVRGEDLRRAVAAFGNVFFQVYGMTEHTCISVLSPWDTSDAQEVLQGEQLESAGKPFLRTEVRIVGEDGRDVPDGQEGDILVRSAGISSGYFNAPELSAEAFVDGWLRTGDIGRMDARGYLYVVDRRKDMIVSGGENIYSREVEDVLASHPAVREVAVIGIPDSRWGETVKAIVALVPGVDALPEAELLELCRQRLAGYKKPRSFGVIDALPRLGHGKVDKKVLRAPYWADRSRRV